MTHTPQARVFTEVVLEVFKLSGLLTAEGDRLTEAHALSSARWKILGSIAQADSPPTVPQIARVMGQTRQAVQRLVNVMHADGLLDFLGNPNHKRAKLVALTTNGKRVYTQLEKSQIPWANQCAGHMNRKELETTLSVLRRISHLF
ncbi:MAG: MarR family transcriptional regulator [Gammaproteobacteria bacterium]|nr:MAG: MarR family transcriptional regulator [Gammaproteobacteria bacterium]